MNQSVQKAFSAASFIASCPSWEDFCALVAELPPEQRDEAFARLCQAFLRTNAIYRNAVDPAKVLLSKEVSADVRSQLNLPAKGIDLVAQSRAGGYWAIKSSFAVSDDLDASNAVFSRLNSLAFERCHGMSHAILIHNGDHTTEPGLSRVGQVGLDEWEGLQQVGWNRILAEVSERGYERPTPKTARPHQQEAVAAAKVHFETNARGRIVLPCGTGKSFVGQLIAEALGANTIVVAVPSLSLIRQTLAGWSEQYDAKGLAFDYLCVCSDEGVVTADTLDIGGGQVGDLGVEVSTDLETIVDHLQRPRIRPLVVFSTYHSSPLLAAASRIANFTFDLGILDEAHKTVGATDRAFATALDDNQIAIRKRIAMTATERVYRGDRTDVLSMGNEADYGACFYKMSFKEAIQRGLVCDYKIVTFFVSEVEVRNLIESKASIHLNHAEHGSLTNRDAQSLAAGIALKSVVRDYGAKHIISFHRSIAAAIDFSRQQDDLNQFKSLGPSVSNFHVSGRTLERERAHVMKRFAESDFGAVSNARCLTEGVDVPNTDCILFADPKQSTVDIIQAAGRAMRISEGKTYGYVVIPVVVPEGTPFDKFASTTEYRKVAQILTALSTQDERIAVDFRQPAAGTGKRKKGGGLFMVEGAVPAGIGMDFERFATAVQTRIWSIIGSLNYRPFKEARSFVQDLGLKNVRQWKAFAKSAKMPPDIPNAADRVYASDGWKDWGDWLGTGAVADAKKKWRPYEEARAFVQSLGLTQATWRDFAKSDRKPSDIPSHPEKAYAEKGWNGSSEWFGTRGHGNWRSFEEARAFVQTLGLQNTRDWLEYAKSKNRPVDIPSAPGSAYANSGWNGLADWIGIAPPAALRFEDDDPTEAPRAHV